MRQHSQHADDTLRRYYEMKQAGDAVRPVGWVQRQFDLIRTEPERFRRRAATLVTAGALLGGAVFAGTNLPTPASEAPALANPAEATVAEAASLRLVTVRGRILDENGHPLVGATVLRKGTRMGVSTDAQGHYALRVPAGQAATLQYAYGGYAEEELQVKAGAVENVTLLPRTEQAEAPAKKRRWLLF